LTPRSVRIVRLRQSTAIIILVIQFVVLGLLAWGLGDLKNLHRFDNLRSYDICLGSNAQIKNVTDALTAPAPIPPDASPTERATTQALNERRVATRVDIDKAVDQNREGCKVFLTRDR
jgi:hypothetical protein